MEKIAPFLRRRGGEVGAIFFLDLGLDEDCFGDAWNLPSEVTGVGFFRLVSPVEGVSALALAHLN